MEHTSQTDSGHDKPNISNKKMDAHTLLRKVKEWTHIWHTYVLNYGHKHTLTLQEVSGGTLSHSFYL